MLGGDLLIISARAEFPGDLYPEGPFSGEVGSETSCMTLLRRSSMDWDMGRSSSSCWKYDSIFDCVRDRDGEPLCIEEACSDRAYEANSAVSSLTSRAFCALSMGAVTWSANVKVVSSQWNVPNCPRNDEWKKLLVGSR